MRFLVITKNVHPVPMELFGMLVEGLQQWADTHLASGKIEQTWSFSGQPAGGGILNVESHEELEEIMTGFPFGNWAETQIIPLSDLHRSIAGMRQAAERMAPPA